MAQLVRARVLNNRVTGSIHTWASERCPPRLDLGQRAAAGLTEGRPDGSVGWSVGS